MLGLQADGLCAAVYTQITDLEDEENGLITYDRRVIKVDEKQMAEISKNVQRNYTHTSIPVMPVSKEGNMVSKWRYYISDSPLASDAWKNASFADTSWDEGIAGFGNGALQGASMNTRWDKPNIYMRKWFDFKQLAAKDIDKLQLEIFHDEECEVYINGILAATLNDITNRYVFTVISKAAKASIKIGQPNLIAVRCSNKTGNQFIDLGFTLVDIPIDK